MFERMRSILVMCVMVCLSHGIKAQHEITFNIEGLADSTAYLGYHLGSSKYIQDTAMVQDGMVIFSGEEQLPHGVYFLYTPAYFLEIVVSEDQTFTVSSDMVEPLVNKQIEGSVDNEIFKNLQMHLAQTQSRNRDLSEQLSGATNNADSTDIYELLEEADQENIAFQRTLTTEYPDSYVTSFVNLLLKPEDIEVQEGVSSEQSRIIKFQHYRDHFFDGIDFTYEGILRTPVFDGRITEYIDRLTSPEPDSLIAAIDFLIGKAETNAEVYRYLVVMLTNKFAQPKLMGHDAIFVHLAENYYLSGKAPWATEEILGNFRKAVNDLKPNLIGAVAPALQLLDTTLSPMSLQEIDAEYTVLFFYDPDCGHCKKQAPELLDFYHQYRNDGVETIGVCIATDLDKWKGFVAEKALDWINAADPYYQSNFRKEYNITSTPTIYVLDRNKVIIGKRLAVEQLSEFIEARIRMDGD